MTAPPDLAHLASWRHDFEGGGIHKMMLLKPKYEPGERLAAVMELVSLSSMGVRQVPGYDEALVGHGQALLFATDRRLFHASGGKVHESWRWAEVESVRILRGARGVVLLPHEVPDSGMVDVAMTGRAAVGWTGKNDHGKADQGWWQTQGAFYASLGRFDEWWARVQALDPTL